MFGPCKNSIPLSCPSPNPVFLSSSLPVTFNCLKAAKRQKPLRKSSVYSVCPQGKKKCECKTNYIGDGVLCELKELPLDRCAQDNGQCHSDAQCTDLHYEGKLTSGCPSYIVFLPTHTVFYMMFMNIIHRNSQHGKYTQSKQNACYSAPNPFFLCVTFFRQ